MLDYNPELIKYDFGEKGDPVSMAVLKSNVPFAKWMSQAFIEASKGDVYLCTPENNSPNNVLDQTLAWGGWKYPALTGNSAVTKVIRVDPSTSVTSQIWAQGDPPTSNAPKG